MQVCSVEKKYEVLKKHISLHGMEIPVIYELSLFSDSSIYIKEILRIPAEDIVLNTSHHRQWRDAEECFPELCATITLSNGNFPPEVPKIMNNGGNRAA